jgi:hypothetical protein
MKTFIYGLTYMAFVFLLFLIAQSITSQISARSDLGLALFFSLLSFIMYAIGSAKAATKIANISFGAGIVLTFVMAIIAGGISIFGSSWDVEYTDHFWQWIFYGLFFGIINLCGMLIARYRSSKKYVYQPKNPDKVAEHYKNKRKK